MGSKAVDGTTLLQAFALMFVIEGLMPLLAPTAWREGFRRVTALADGQIRFLGLSSVLAGVLLLTIFS
jgi:uncharacterized protein YjeT (DUF2065 family)